MDGLPAQYLFHLVCCFQSDCPHPICRSGNIKHLQWFENGPPVTSIPLPIPDPSQPWGASNCSKCKGFCSGHYLTPEETFLATSNAVEPPSALCL